MNKTWDRVRRALGREASIEARLAEVEMLLGRGGLLDLWFHAYVSRGIEDLRLLAVVSRLESPEASACRLWLAGNVPDSAVRTTLLSVVESQVYESREFSTIERWSAVQLILRSLRDSSANTRFSVLSLLTMIARKRQVGAFIPPNLREHLSNLLEANLRDLAEEEEHDEITLVVASLTTLDSSDWSDQELSVGIEALTHQAAESSPALETIERELRTEIVRLSALRHSCRSRSPVHTFRILRPHAPSKLMGAILDFGKATAGLPRVRETEESDPVYDPEIAWAPAASFPIHLLYKGDHAVVAFEFVNDLVSTSNSSQSAADSADPQLIVSFERIASIVTSLNQPIELTVTDSCGDTLHRAVTIDNALLGNRAYSRFERKLLSGLRFARAVSAKHIPQANTIAQVLECMDAIEKKGVATVDDISGLTTDRQVLYYKHGARVLGLLDQDDQPTERARALRGLTLPARLPMVSIYFEDSVVGRAWRVWSGVARLVDVSPASAEDFLRAVAEGLSGTTIPRRASSLRAWWEELAPSYPASQEASDQ